MAFTNITTTQNVFLVNYLRGTNRSLTVRQARSLFGIKNLRARLSELRDAGLVVRTERVEGSLANKYYMSARDVYGSRASVLS